MNVMSLHARKNVNAAAVNAAAVTAAAVNATKVTKTTNTLILNAKDNTAYIINHRDSVIANGDNPTLSLRRGQTYIFENKSSTGHTFRIDKVAKSSYSYDTGLAATASSGASTLTMNENITLKKGDKLTGSGISGDTEVTVTEDVVNSTTVNINTSTTAAVNGNVTFTDGGLGFTIDGIGVNGNNAAGPTGTLTFNVPANAPDDLYYYCTSDHPDMKGTINIID
jgi:hypothetical protein